MRRTVGAILAACVLALVCWPERRERAYEEGVWWA